MRLKACNCSHFGNKIAVKLGNTRSQFAFYSPQFRRLFASWRIVPARTSASVRSRFQTVAVHATTIGCGYVCLGGEDNAKTWLHLFVYNNLQVDIIKVIRRDLRFAAGFPSGLFRGLRPLFRRAPSRPRDSVTVATARFPHSWPWILDLDP